MYMILTPRAEHLKVAEVIKIESELKKLIAELEIRSDRAISYMPIMKKDFQVFLSQAKKYQLKQEKIKNEQEENKEAAKEEQKQEIIINKLEKSPQNKQKRIGTLLEHSHTAPIDIQNN